MPTIQNSMRWPSSSSGAPCFASCSASASASARSSVASASAVIARVMSSSGAPARCRARPAVRAPAGAPPAAPPAAAARRRCSVSISAPIAARDGAPGRQQRQLVGIAAAHALHEAAVCRRNAVDGPGSVVHRRAGTTLLAQGSLLHCLGTRLSASARRPALGPSRRALRRPPSFMFDAPTAAPLAGPPWLLQLRRVVALDAGAAGRGVERTARRLADPALGDSAAHRAVAPADRATGQCRRSVSRCASARIDVQSRGWVPALELQRRGAADADGREALRLPRVAAALSARSLLALELRFEQLLIDGAQLEVRRDALGRLHVAGIAIGGAAQDDDSACRRLVLRAARVRHPRRPAALDRRDARVAPPLELSDVTLVVRNGLRRHDLRLDATPPPAGASASRCAGASRSRCSRAPATGGAGAARCTPSCRVPTCASCAAMSTCRSS